MSPTEPVHHVSSFCLYLIVHIDTAANNIEFTMASSSEESFTTAKTAPGSRQVKLEEDEPGSQKGPGRNGKHRFVRRVKTGCLTCK